MISPQGNYIWQCRWTPALKEATQQDISNDVIGRFEVAPLRLSTGMRSTAARRIKPSHFVIEAVTVSPVTAEISPYASGERRAGATAARSHQRLRDSPECDHLRSPAGQPPHPIRQIERPKYIVVSKQGAGGLKELLE
jgi:hypothetical protein